MHLSTQPLARPWRLARVGATALALAAAALTVSGAASPAATTGSTATVGSTATAAACLTAAPDQRVRVGQDVSADPNSLTQGESRTLQRRLQARAGQRSTGPDGGLLGRTRIDVYVHVITKTNGKGGVSTKRIKQQIAVLNKAYAGSTSVGSTSTPFYFKLKKIDKTKKSSWYYWATPTPQGDPRDDVAPKKKLHRGNWGDLNLYITKPSDGVLGYATFPDATSLKRDGVVVLGSSLPGGSMTGYNGGDTATHEVGHWLGLFHTFQGGCSPLGGDGVDDTPAQADGQNIFSCEEALDTCLAPGLDPVHNFMSYGDDDCLDRFTPGQVARMTESWLGYRAPGSRA